MRDLDGLQTLLNVLNHYLWGPPMLILITLTGLYLMAGMRCLPLRHLAYAFRLLFARSKKVNPCGDISPFNALMTALSGAVGTGNIVGVATAIHLGGPGALFYMWLVALIGMAISFTEATCGVKFRQKDHHGRVVGGPMFYIREALMNTNRGLGHLLAALYAFLAAFSVLSIGNMVQINSIAAILAQDFGVQTWLTGILVMCLVGAVILGGIKRIADLAGKLVPFMIVLYLLSGVFILVQNAVQILPMFLLIIREAFTVQAVSGGVFGGGIVAAMRYGVSRGIFSNEAGIGTGSIAHAAAKTNDPVRQGHIAMLGTFIDTIIVCSITGFVILVTQSYKTGETGAVLTGHAFARGLTGGNFVVVLALLTFAFTTMIAYSYYGEKCMQYLVGDWVTVPYRLLWLIVIPFGAVFKLELVWSMCETMMALMMIPNLIGLFFLGPVVFKMTLSYRR